MSDMLDVISVEKYLQLPRTPTGALELHNGEVVSVPRPAPDDMRVLIRTQELLNLKLARFGHATCELVYRPVKEYDVRTADVAVLSHERTADTDIPLRGAPDLVVKLLSGFYSSRELMKLTAMALTSGAREVWVLDTANHYVTVAHQDGSVSLYKPGDNVPLQAFGEDAIPVSEIF
jgi:Uma2 family endonuclease